MNALARQIQICEHKVLVAAHIAYTTTAAAVQGYLCWPFLHWIGLLSIKADTALIVRCYIGVLLYYLLVWFLM